MNCFDNLGARHVSVARYTCFSVTTQKIRLLRLRSKYRICKMHTHLNSLKQLRLGFTSLFIGENGVYNNSDASMGRGSAEPSGKPHVALCFLRNTGMVPPRA